MSKRVKAAKKVTKKLPPLKQVHAKSERLAVACANHLCDMLQARRIKSCEAFLITLGFAAASFVYILSEDGERQMNSFLDSVADQVLRSEVALKEITDGADTAAACPA